MRCAVVGASGFVGRHVLAELRRVGVEALAVSRSGASVDGHAGLALDVAAPPSDPFQALGRPDVVIHLAWGWLQDYRSLAHVETELPTHYRFLAALVRGGLSRLVATGTCLEYGMMSGPLAESLQPAPTTPYGFAKDALRRQLGFLRRETPFEFAWARLFYLYGEGQSARSLYPLLHAAAARGERTFPMSGGEQLRDYLPVTEAARLLVALALRGGDPGIVNVCSGEPVSVRRLVEGWIAERGFEISLDLGRYPYPDYEPLAFWGDRAKLDRTLAGGAEERTQP
ncbi:NAD-dependent epimerase/dehydratase family protein [Salinarimonas sp.]|uniref:NAD-dependent epimerase/dehydratase family protein n=1 Tax=Salinarimonas sp. TaxID=2766526 RepID=UPI00391D79E5